MRHHLLFVALAVAATAAPAALAQEAPFAASRPGETEGPIAVPAGKLQVETEIASLTKDKQAGVKTDGVSLASTTLRYGLGNGFDTELIVSPWQRQTAKGVGFKDTADGFGDVTLRLRKTFLGEDGDGPALAVIGFLTLPTAKDGLGADDTEGGVILTGSAPVAKDWGMAWTVGAAARSMGGGDYQAEFSGALQLNHAFSDAVGAFVEVAATRAEHDSDTAATFDIGATWLTGPTTQLDAGANFGITDAADDATVFIGWAHRF